MRCFMLMPCILWPLLRIKTDHIVVCRWSFLVAVQKEKSFKEYLAYLPPLEIATEAVVLLTLLGSIFYTK